MPTYIPSLPIPEGPESRVQRVPDSLAAAAVVSVDNPVSARQAGAATGDRADEVAPRYQATGLITASERQHLGRLARDAWEKCGAKGAGIGCDEWRHEQVAIATEEKATRLSDLRRGQYKDVLRHFLELAGDSARAFRVAQRSGQGAADRDLAMAKLRDVCESGGLAFPDYPDSICRRQFKCALESLETGKVWFLFYTCTRRARAKNQKGPEIAPETPISNPAVVTLADGCEAGNPVGGPGEGQA